MILLAAGPAFLAIARKAGVIVSVMRMRSWADGTGESDLVALTGIEPMASRASSCTGPVAWVCPTGD
jgi:hypothetical protein